MDSDKKVFDITVKKSAKSAPSTKTADEPADEPTFKVPVRSNLSAPEAAEVTSNEELTAERHEVNIKPAEVIGDETAATYVDTGAEPTDLNKPMVEDAFKVEVKSEPDMPEDGQVAPNVDTSEPQAVVTTEEAAAPAAEPSIEQAATDATEPSSPEGQQTPTVFDTKQYHLPIKESKSHNAGKHMLWFVIIFLLIVAIGGVVAIDAGWLDIGVKLPFDLIK